MGCRPRIMLCFFFESGRKVNRIINPQAEGQRPDGDRLRVDVVARVAHQSVDPNYDHHEGDPRDETALQTFLEIVLIAEGVDGG